MATDTKKDLGAQDKDAARAQARRETLTKIDSPQAKVEPKLTPEQVKQKAEETKAEHAAIEKVAKINQNLAKDGSANRVDVQMRAGEPHYRWGNFVPTRELTPEELDAVDTLGAPEPTKPKVPADEPASRKVA